MASDDDVQLTPEQYQQGLQSLASDPDAQRAFTDKYGPKDTQNTNQPVSWKHHLANFLMGPDSVNYSWKDPKTGELHTNESQDIYDAPFPIPSQPLVGGGIARIGNILSALKNNPENNLGVAGIKGGLGSLLAWKHPWLGLGLLGSAAKNMSTGLGEAIESTKPQTLEQYMQSLSTPKPFQPSVQELSPNRELLKKQLMKFSPKGAEPSYTSGPTQYNPAMPGGTNQLPTEVTPETMVQQQGMAPNPGLLKKQLLKYTPAGEPTPQTSGPAKVLGGPKHEGIPLTDKEIATIAKGPKPPAPRDESGKFVSPSATPAPKPTGETVVGQISPEAKAILTNKAAPPPKVAGAAAASRPLNPVTGKPQLTKKEMDIIGKTLQDMINKK
jgi:hypothetical protein